MPERSPVPNLPPLSGIQDPAVRSYLEALTQAWLVRNGQTRETGERWLTLNDLKSGFSQAIHGGGVRLLDASSSGGTQTASVIAAAIQALADSIQQSRLWRLLGERIEQIEMPEWFRGRFGAEIRTEQIKEENARNAMAQEVRTAITNVNNNIAITQNKIKAVSDLAGATASDVTTLQTQVGNTTTVAQQAFSLAQSTDGKLTGYWGVKFDSEGYLPGFGLSLDGTTQAPRSGFAVRADNFVIGPAKKPQDFNSNAEIPFITLTVPTVIGGVTYLPGVYIKTACIADASIGSAKIAFAAIDTLRLAGNAVTIPVAVSSRPNIELPIVADADTSTAPPSRYALVATIAIDFSQGAPAAVFLTGMVEGANLGGAASLHVALAKNGVLVWLNSVSVFNGYTNQCVLSYTDNNPGVGVVVYHMYAAASGPNVRARNVSLAGIGAKR